MARELLATLSLIASMLLLATSLLIVGGLVALLNVAWMLALAFQRSVGWGFAFLLVPGGTIAFTCRRWRQARIPFLIGIYSLLLMFSALVAMPANLLPSGVNRGLAWLKITPSLDQPELGARITSADQDAEFQLQLLHLKQQEKELLDRQSTLELASKAEAAALLEEIDRYNTALAAALPLEKRLRLVAR